MGGLLQLTGRVQPDEWERLRRQNAELEAELANLKLDLERVKGERERALKAILALRHNLHGQFMALKAIFGEIEAVGLTETEASPSSSTRRGGIGKGGEGGGKWDLMKQKYPGKVAEFIDLLLLHGEMGPTQLKHAARCSLQTVYNTIDKMKSLGLLSDLGRGRYGLRELS